MMIHVSRHPPNTGYRKVIYHTSYRCHQVLFVYMVGRWRPAINRSCKPVSSAIQLGAVINPSGSTHQCTSDPPWCALKSSRCTTGDVCVKHSFRRRTTEHRLSRSLVFSTAAYTHVGDSDMVSPCFCCYQRRCCNRGRVVPQSWHTHPKQSIKRAALRGACPRFVVDPSPRKNDFTLSSPLKHYYDSQCTRRRG